MHKITFDDIADIFACSAKGVGIELDAVKDYNAILNESIVYGVGTVVYSGLKKNNICIAAEFDSKFMPFLYRNTQKNIRIYDVLNILKSNNIDFLILKGASLAQLYSDIHSRISSDTDIYIKESDIDKVCEIMRNLGFDVLPRWEGSHHTKCISSSCGMIELHTQFFDKLVSKLWFDNEEYMEITKRDFLYDGYTFSTLDYSEGLIFNFLHFIKHFISGDFSLMQLMDNLLYMQKYNDKIDYNKIVSVLEKLGYCKFLKICIGFGIKYFRFHPNDFYLKAETSQKLIALLAEEFLKRAYEKVENLYDLYGKKVYETKTKSGSYYKYRNKINNNKKGYFIVDKKHFEDRYPILKKYKFMYPLCYIHRAVLGFFRLFGKKKVNTTTGNRMDVLNKFGMWQ